MKLLLFIILTFIFSQSLNASLCENYNELFYSSWKKAQYYDENQRWDDECRELKRAESYLMDAYGHCSKVNNFETTMQILQRAKSSIHCK